MRIATKFEKSFNSDRREAFVLCSSWWKNGAAPELHSPKGGIGLLGFVNYRSGRSGKTRAALQIAFRAWNGFSMKLKIGPLTVLLALIAFGVNSAPESPAPLLHAHAHNDYEHSRPLLDALDHGFCSVEADIYLVDGQLLVAHDRAKVSPARTLQSLYLDPLRARVKKNGGRVFPNGPEVTLLIDVKTEAETTYAALRKVLDEYADMLTAFQDNTIQTNAITVILSGNRPLATLASEKFRRASIDGRLADLDGTAPISLIPLISDNWTKSFKWHGTGPFPADEKTQLVAIVKRAHAQGRRVRFWATADVPEVWRELRQAGVDLLNTDDLAGVQRFFESETRHGK
jgi:glycerophosphoryl diester phosphodiesterase